MYITGIMWMWLGCGGGEVDVLGDTAANGTGTANGTNGGVGYEVDPDVQTFVPDGYLPTAPVRVVYMGDSITAGVGASSFSLEYPSLLEANSDSAWPDHADETLSAAYPTIEEWINVSVGGATTSSMKQNQLSDLEARVGLPAEGETLIFVTIGGNDAQQALLPFADVDTIAQAALDNIDDMARWLTDPANFPDGVYVYFTNIYEPSDGTGQSQCFFGMDYSDNLAKLDVMNGGLISMGTDIGFAAVDLNGHFRGHGMNNENPTIDAYDEDDPSRWFDNDCLHPNDRGHHEVRRLFYYAAINMPLPLDP